MPLYKNVQGEYVYQDDGGQWLPAPRARNERTGQEHVWDGKAWGPVGPVNDTDFAGRAAAMSPPDLGVARSKNDPFGNYLREQATPFSAGIKGPIPPGSPSDQANVKAYGDLGYRRPGIAEGSVRSAYQGYMQGAGDEAVAAMAATLDPLRNQNAQPSTWAERYNLAKARETGELDRFRQDHPYITAGTEMAGAVVPALAIPGAGASTLGGRLALSTGTGTGQGFIYGFNAGEGGAAARARNAFVPAAVGGGFGAVAPVVGAGVRAIAQARATGQAARDAGISTPAYRVLNRNLAGDDAMGPAGQQRMAAAGPDAMLVDASPSARDTLDATMQSGGPGVRVAREAIDARAARANEQITGALDTTFGAPQGVNATARGIAQSTAPARSTAYDAAYSLPINYASLEGRAVEAALGRVSPRVMQDAVREANEQMLADGVTNQQIMARIADDGTLSFVEMPNVQQLDQIKRALGTLGSEAVDQFGRRTAQGNRAFNLSNDLRDAITRAVPEYGEAVRLGGDKIALDNALALGTRLLRPGTTREAVTDTVGRMSEAERRMVGQGVRQHIDDTLANVKRTVDDPNVEAREAMQAVKDLSSRSAREKVASLLGQDAADQFYVQLDRASTALNLRAGVANNSRTSVRETVKQQMRAVADGGLMGAVREGQPASWQQRIATAVLRRPESSRVAAQDQLGLDLARALTGPNGAEILRAITANQGRAQLTGDNARRLAELIVQRNATVTSPLIEGLR